MHGYIIDKHNHKYTNRHACLQITTINEKNINIRIKQNPKRNINQKIFYRSGCRIISVCLDSHQLLPCHCNYPIQRQVT